MARILAHILLNLLLFLLFQGNAICLFFGHRLRLGALFILPFFSLIGFVRGFYSLFCLLDWLLFLDCS